MCCWVTSQAAWRSRALKCNESVLAFCEAVFWRSAFKTRRWVTSEAAWDSRALNGNGQCWPSRRGCEARIWSGSSEIWSGRRQNWSGNGNRGGACPRLSHSHLCPGKKTPGLGSKFKNATLKRTSVAGAMVAAVAQLDLGSMTLFAARAWRLSSPTKTLGFRVSRPGGCKVWLGLQALKQLTCVHSDGTIGLDLGPGWLDGWRGRLGGPGKALKGRKRALRQAFQQPLAGVRAARRPRLTQFRVQDLGLNRA